jgi:hypothetical protein
MRVVAHGEKWCRPQPGSKNSVRVTTESGPNVFENQFWLLAGGVVFLWVCLRVFDFTLLPPAYNGVLITQPFCGLHSWDVADRAWAARSHLKYGLGYTKGLRTLVVAFFSRTGRDHSDFSNSRGMLILCLRLWETLPNRRSPMKVWPCVAMATRS